MSLGIIIWSVAIIFVCLLGLPKKWEKDSNIKIFKVDTSAPYVANMYFDDFIEINAHHGIKINLVRIEKKDYRFSCSETWFYYTEEKLKATNEN